MTLDSEPRGAQAGALVPAQLSIVIVSWNTRDMLAACIESILEAPPSTPFEVIVVDNASADGSADMIAERFPSVLLIRNERNSGFAAANNRAFDRVAGDLVLLLNSDTEVSPGAVDLLMDYLTRRPDVGIVAPRLVHPDGSLQPSCQRAPTAVRELIHLARLDALLPGLYYPMRRWPTDAPRSVDVVMGACLLVRRDVLEQAGRLHEGYFMYSEEVELCERVRAAGRRIDWLPQAVVMHHGGASAEPVADEMFLALYRSKALFHRRNRGPLALAAFRGVIVLAALPRLVAGLAAAVPLLGGARRAKLRRTARRYVRLLRALPEMG